MKVTTLLPYFSLFAGLSLLVQAQVDYNEYESYDARNYVDELAERDYFDELTARDLIMDYDIRSELIAELKTRELVEKLQNRLDRKTNLHKRGKGVATKFHKAVSIVSTLPKHGSVQISQADQLFFYKYYMQATVGDNNAHRPAAADFAGRAKWDAWHSVHSVSKEEAEKQYVNKALAILQAAGDKKHVEEIHAA
ncbi:hypothetical protein CVT25_006422 [Psilocybe cyanescens]|uniref:ACB domain-containing protein n=1 Tax=Psilocybe cyanescens TaxID=93625 RepID=A0A409X3R1_PSICY|nr:hypothetical protein CVT25_006422 [Psilocybe cyanescens]